MKQMRITPSKIVKVDYTGAAKALKPVVYKEGGSFCCLLGSDPDSGVFGRGDTPELALSDWEDNLKHHLKTSGPDDDIIKLVKNLVSKDPKPVSKQVQAFYDQFKPLKKKS